MPSGTPNGRVPSPEFRAPGDDTPVLDPPIDLPTGPNSAILIEAPDAPDLQAARAAQLAVGRETRIANLAEEDADIRVVATALRTRGHSVPEIALRLGVPAARVRRVLKQSRMDGNLVDVLSDLTNEALPLAMEKLIEKLEDGVPWAIQQTLKGGGVFRTYHAGDGEGQKESRTLDVTFVMPATPQVMDVRGIVGAPRLEVIDAVQVQGATAEVPRDGGDRGDFAGGSPQVGRGDETGAGGLQGSALVRAVAAARGE
jgi:hypothetical protein